MKSKTSLLTIVNAIEAYMVNNPKNAPKLQSILAYEIANFSKPKAKKARAPKISSSSTC